ncbi:MAG: hypothetical protein MI739_12600, partial [Bacteroidales bacterium]|nr:hypothetical protein [Bacteroidales bacterium]
RGDLEIVNDYLIVADYMSVDKGIYIYNKKTHEHVASTGSKGRGPHEVISYSFISKDCENNSFYMPDYGRDLLYKFELDSIFENPKYLPSIQYDFNNGTKIFQVGIIDDSLAVCRTGKLLNPNTLKSYTGKVNINSGKVTKICSPLVEKKNLQTLSAYSKKHDLYVEAYSNFDLITGVNQDGEKIFETYGPEWHERIIKKKFFNVVRIIGDKILVKYCGKKRISINENGRRISTPSTKIMVFNLQGRYQKTLELRTSIYSFTGDGGMLYILSGDDGSIYQLDANDLLQNEV